MPGGGNDIQDWFKSLPIITRIGRFSLLNPKASNQKLFLNWLLMRMVGGWQVGGWILQGILRKNKIFKIHSSGHCQFLRCWGIVGLEYIQCQFTWLAGSPVCLKVVLVVIPYIFKSSAKKTCKKIKKKNISKKIFFQYTCPLHLSSTPVQYTCPVHLSMSIKLYRCCQFGGHLSTEQLHLSSTPVQYTCLSKGPVCDIFRQAMSSGIQDDQN